MQLLVGARIGCQSSSGVEQRTHKPLVGGSNPSSGTSSKAFEGSELQIGKLPEDGNTVSAQTVRAYTAPARFYSSAADEAAVPV